MVPFLIAEILSSKPLDKTIEICGWLKTKRETKDFSFLELNDGSCLASLQIIAPQELHNYHETVTKLSTGCSLKIRGTVKQSPAKGQEIELLAEELELLGWADPDKYPLQKKRHSFEFLRSIAHLRPRTNSLGAITRIRSSLAFAVHVFFQERGFFQVHTPIISTSDCEGAGEMFRVESPATIERTGIDRSTEEETGFFGRPANLTVSGQLQAEAFALSMGRVYTFGPTFRAENSNTSRHLAEFWMVEPEVAFCDLEADLDLAESFLKYLVDHALEHCTADLDLFARFIDKRLYEKLDIVRTHSFERISYAEAIKILQNADRSFAFPIHWGLDLQAEHERYLCETIFKKPVFVKDYPKDIKPFYMRLNDDLTTVAAMDLLLPGIGEIIGGSQREERFDILIQRIEELGFDIEEYSWYLDLRSYGTAPHSGFGLGFERLLQFITSMENIRDVIPFPRTPGSAPF
jgi:asparaginyl-tRNA synthetase